MKTEFEIFEQALARDYKNEMEVWKDDAGTGGGIYLKKTKVTFYFENGKLDFIENSKYEDY